MFFLYILFCNRAFPWEYVSHEKGLLFLQRRIYCCMQKVQCKRHRKPNCSCCIGSHANNWLYKRGGSNNLLKFFFLYRLYQFLNKYLYTKSLMMWWIFETKTIKYLHTSSEMSFLFYDVFPQPVYVFYPLLIYTCL